MNEREVLIKHYLKVLVELDLYPKLRCLSEGTKVTNIDTAKRELIGNFINGLPNKYKEIEGYEKIITETIEKMEQKDRER